MSSKRTTGRCAPQATGVHALLVPLHGKVRSVIVCVVPLPRHAVTLNALLPVLCPQRHLATGFDKA